MASSTYLTAAQFKAQANDQDLSSYTDDQLDDILVRASGAADAIMRKSYLHSEQTIRFYGTGSNRLELNEHPINYVKRVALVVPGFKGQTIPVDQLLVDAKAGELLEYTPLLWADVDLVRFPDGVPVDVTMGIGYGYTFDEPVYTVTDVDAAGIEPGTYNLAVTLATMWGETTASVKQVSTSGQLSITIKPALGAYLFKYYLSKADNNTTLTVVSEAGDTSFTLAGIGTLAIGDVLLVGDEYLEIKSISGSTITTTTAALNDHADGTAVIMQPLLADISQYMAYGAASPYTQTLQSLTPDPTVWQDFLPLEDTASAQPPAAIIEAVRLLALSIIWEQNNPSNQGISAVASGRKKLQYRSTEGTSGKGVPLAVEQASAHLQPYSLQEIF